MKAVELLARLKAVGRINLGAVAKAVAQEETLVFARKQLATGGRHGGKPWRGFNAEPKYAAYKLAVVGHLEPLRWERQPGGLEDALTNQRSGLRRWKTTSESATLLINLPYIKQLEIGGVGPFGERFPARPIFPSGAQLRRDSVARAKDKFLVEVQRSGLKVQRR